MPFLIEQNLNPKNNDVELLVANHNSFAKINLSKGASLQELTLNNKQIIKDLYPLMYKDTYASSILFPFVSRIEKGTYFFEGKEYQMNTQKESIGNALHGFVYNKEFLCKEKQLSEKEAKIVVAYDEVVKRKGFPFTYKIVLEYTISNTQFFLKVKVKNTDTKTFPFTIGWHPYFYSDNLAESVLSFDSHKKVLFDENLITKEVIACSNKEGIQIKNQLFDDCFFLTSDTILFKTPTYVLKLKSSLSNQFLQVYTPPKENTIAIEPVTGISNSFNNKIGLKYLKPNEMFEITWELNLEKG